tara:strand:+ start:3249 stop:3500 length:252 start_codon:yes stop_codon:yes gene_type:complete
MLLDIRSKLSDNSRVFSKKIHPGDLVRYKYHHERKNDIGLVMQIVEGDQSPLSSGGKAAYILWPNHFKQYCALHLIELYRSAS